MINPPHINISDECKNLAKIHEKEPNSDFDDLYPKLLTKFKNNTSNKRNLSFT
jgi:hypothetical protein